MTAEEYFGDWGRVVDIPLAKATLRRLTMQGKPICPMAKDIFKAFSLCGLDDLRCVIIGQDPYPQVIDGKPLATGLAFANPRETVENAYSPSLKVLMESVINFSMPHGTVNFDPSLETWERQGVLLLNAALSCQAGRIGSHTLLWRPFLSRSCKGSLPVGQGLSMC